MLNGLIEIDQNGLTYKRRNLMKFFEPAAPIIVLIISLIVAILLVDPATADAICSKNGNQTTCTITSPSDPTPRYDSCSRFGDQSICNSGTIYHGNNYDPQ